VASYTLELECNSGLGTLNVKLALAGSDTVAATISFTERTEMKGFYVGTFTGTLDGVYNASIAAGSAQVGTDQFELTSVGGTFQAVGIRSVQVAAISSFLAGNGSRAVTITVRNAAAAPVQGATVRVTKGAETFHGVTNASGQVPFSLNDGTWTVSITASGFTFTPTSLSVSGSMTPPVYTLTSVSFTPSAPGAITGFYTCYDEDGATESGVQCTVTLVQLPAGTTGLAGDTTIRTETSNSSGIVQFTGLFPGAIYSFRRGDGAARKVAIPADATSPYALANIIGSP
jgi:hypothetical protein